MYSYKWQDAIDLASPLLKGLGGFQDIAVRVCDMVSSDMYVDYPWKDTITTIAKNTIPLLNNVQDYDSPINIYRLIKATLLRTDVTPNWTRTLDVVDDTDINLTPRSVDAIRSCSQQQGAGTLRLESAVCIPSGTLVQLIGEYQLNPIKITALGQECWFKDQYFQVAIEGILYWGYKLSDDARAGSATTDDNGRIAYSGQMAIYRSNLYRMRMDEDYGALNGLYPSEGMGSDGFNGGLYAYVFGQ